MLYHPSDIYKPIIIEDIRAQEVRKLLTSFPKESLVYLNGNEMNIMFDNTVLYKITLKTEVPLDNNQLYFYSKSILDMENDNVLIYDKFVCDYMIQYLSNININNLLFTKSNLREDEEFETLINLKSGDGMKFYRLVDPSNNNTYMIPIFTKFPDINKQDEVSISIYNSFENNILVIDMCIFKKKFNRDLHMIYKILNI